MYREKKQFAGLRGWGLRLFVKKVVMLLCAGTHRVALFLIIKKSKLEH